MKTRRSWAQTIRAPWFSIRETRRSLRATCCSAVLFLLAVGLAVMPAPGQGAPADPLQRLAASYRASPNLKDRAALLHFAAANPRSLDAALARLALARGEVALGRPQDALQHIEQATVRLSSIRDYLLYLEGLAHARADSHQQATAAYAKLLADFANSPLRTDAAIAAANSWLSLQRPDDAIRVLKTPGLKERQPEFDFLLGKSYLLRDDPALAAVHLQRVYTTFPARKEAADASILLGQIQPRLGDSYPPLTGQDLLQRGEALRNARLWDAARKAFLDAIPQLLGEDRERAQVLVAAVDYDRMETTAAQQALQAMTLKSPEADAHRLNLLVQCARRLKQEDSMLRHARTLRERHPQSPWTMDAHRWAGNHFLLDNAVDRYVPLFTACADAQPRNPESAYCHWKVAWNAYLERKAGAHQLLSAHLERYPFSDKYAAALFFLGRLAERDRRLAAAAAYYQEVALVEPLSYYAELAADSLRGRLLTGITADPELAGILAGFRGRPLRESFRSAALDTETRRHLDRAALLARIEFMDWVELEIRSYSEDAAQRQLLATGLAGIYARRGDHFRALRTMKSMAPGYFRLQPAQAPDDFWKLLFPMPYGSSLARHSRDRGIDPYLVAGLIRQESEFKPDAVSRAKAYGLMQVLPSTGRSLARTLGLGPFSVRMLTRPEVNINMGTYYLANLGQSFDGQLHYVLASYNAGKSRADRWKTWADFQEPIEFIETIPFTETREYVLSVYRNAMVYRAVYPDLEAVPTQITPVSSPAPVARPTPVKAAAAKPATAKPKTTKRKPVARKRSTAAKPAATKKP